MIRRLFGMLLAIAAFQFPATAAAQDLDPDRVEAYADGFMRAAMESNKVAGATIAVVKDGRTVLAKGYGLARVDPRPQRTDADTLFQVASISKTPVYIAIMQLAEAGRLRLDDPANAHLPTALQIPGQGFKQPILIRHLMTHSAGFEDSALGHLFIDGPERLLPISQYLGRFRPDRVNPPGLQASYSNYAVALLGAIIEHRSGIDFPTYMEQRILRPLGMLRSTYRDSYDPAIMRRLGLPAPMDPAAAANRTQQLGGEPPIWKEASPEYTAMVAPAAGLHASANDMARYALALADPARLEAAGVLKAATFAEMMRPGIALPGAVSHGFINYRLQGGRAGFGHGGAMAYGASDLIVVPDLKLAVFVSTNGRGGFAFANDLVSRMLKDLAPLPESQPVRTDETRQQAKALAGDWFLNRRPWSRTEAALHYFVAGFSVKAEDNGDLLIGGLLGETERFQPIGNGVWQSPSRYRVKIAAKDANGMMTLWSGGGDGGAVRAGLLQRPLVMVIVLGLTVICGTIAAVRLVSRRAWPASSFERYARRSAGLAGLAWALGLGGFFVILGQAVPDGGARLTFTYPGPVVWIAWTIALAAILTLIAAPGIAVLARPGEWSMPRRICHAALLTLFVAATIGCWSIGLVGYSGL
jgi:CubicO group peptidase (beta-lactamase class C family)